MSWIPSLLVVVVLLSVSSANPLYIPLAVGAALQLDVFTAAYSWLLQSFTDFQACFLICSALPIGVYWVNGLLFLLADVFKRPEVINQFKLQPDKGFDVYDYGLVRKVVTNLLVGQIFVILPVAYLYSKLTVAGYGFRMSSELPSPSEMFHHYVWFAVLNEPVFYYGHALLHTKSLYQKVHKIHHEFKAPIALVASYCHPLEMLISNVIPLTLTGLFLRVHLYTMAVWVVFAILGTQLHHGGYKWPWISSSDEQPDFHDFHHESFTSNLGVMGWLDMIHGTSKPYLELLAKKSKKKGSPSKPVDNLVNPWQIQVFTLALLAMVPVRVLEQLP